MWLAENMNQLVTSSLTGEVLDQTVRVIGRPKPLQQHIIRADLPCGLTVAELLDLALAGECSSLTDYAAYVNGVPVPVEWRDKVRVKGGATLTFAPRLHQKHLKEISLLAVAVVALVLAPYIAGPSILALTGTYFTVATSLIATGIASAGDISLNALEASA
jgi:hypothetical protein